MAPFALQIFISVRIYSQSPAINPTKENQKNTHTRVDLRMVDAAERINICSHLSLSHWNSLCLFFLSQFYSNSTLLLGASAAGIEPREVICDKRRRWRKDAAACRGVRWEAKQKIKKRDKRARARSRNGAPVSDLAAMQVFWFCAWQCGSVEKVDSGWSSGWNIRLISRVFFYYQVL